VPPAALGLPYRSATHAQRSVADVGDVPPLGVPTRHVPAEPPPPGRVAPPPAVGGGGAAVVAPGGAVVTQGSLGLPYRPIAPRQCGPGYDAEAPPPACIGGRAALPPPKAAAAAAAASSGLGVVRAGDTIAPSGAGVAGGRSAYRDARHAPNTPAYNHFPSSSEMDLAPSAADQYSKRLMNLKGLTDMFAAIDKDGDGQVGFEEFPCKSPGKGESAGAVPRLGTDPHGPRVFYFGGMRARSTKW